MINQRNLWKNFEILSLNQTNKFGFINKQCSVNMENEYKCQWGKFRKNCKQKVHGLVESKHYCFKHQAKMIQKEKKKEKNFLRRNESYVIIGLVLAAIAIIVSVFKIQS